MAKVNRGQGWFARLAFCVNTKQPSPLSFPKSESLSCPPPCTLMEALSQPSGLLPTRNFQDLWLPRTLAISHVRENQVQLLSVKTDFDLSGENLKVVLFPSTFQ